MTAVVAAAVVTPVASEFKLVQCCTVEIVILLLSFWVQHSFLLPLLLSVCDFDFSYLHVQFFVITMFTDGSIRFASVRFGSIQFVSFCSASI